MARKREHLAADAHEADVVRVVPGDHRLEVAHVLEGELLGVLQALLLERRKAAGARAEHGRVLGAEDGVQAGVAEAALEVRRLELGDGRDVVDDGLAFLASLAWRRDSCSGLRIWRRRWG